MPSQPENKISESKIVLSRYEKALFALDKRKLKAGMATLYPEYAFFLGNNWQDTMNVPVSYTHLDVYKRQ